MAVVITLVLLALGYGLYRMVRKPENPYVAFHKLKLKNDRNYSTYLQWCYRNQHIPMDKYDYIKEITDKENMIKDSVGS